jgi:hypothetical protein
MAQSELLVVRVVRVVLLPKAVLHLPAVWLEFAFEPAVLIVREESPALAESASGAPGALAPAVVVQPAPVAMSARVVPLAPVVSPALGALVVLAEPAERVALAVARSAH